MLWPIDQGQMADPLILCYMCKYMSSPSISFHVSDPSHVRSQPTVTCKVSSHLF